MNNPFAKLARRERLYLMAGAVVLFGGLVVYPGTKAATAYREEQRELLEDDLALLEDLYALELDAFAIEDEYDALSSALKKADDLLFPPIENRILTQTAMIKLLNELGPDLELETTAGRSAVGAASNQLTLQVKGEGRYPELLKFLHRLETYRPLILVQDLSMSERRTRRRRRNQSTETSEPQLSLSMNLQIICRDRGEK